MYNTFKNHWTVCSRCKGVGKVRQKLTKKMKTRYKRELKNYERDPSRGILPSHPIGHLGSCDHCSGTGLSSTKYPTSVDDKNYPHIAIIGGGISGIALAVCCSHRGIPYTLYERDTSFDARSQGYGLTLQQANKALRSFGINSCDDEIRTNRHIVFDTQGKLIGEWGKEKIDATINPKKQKNTHIARQGLRLHLLEQIRADDSLKWGYKLRECKQGNEGVDLVFDVNNKTEVVKADLVVGADGIRSTVRKSLIEKEMCPLQYSGLVVILGVCRYEEIGMWHDLLDGHTVFQTVNGHERIYVMPYSHDAIMWQMSFPMPEDEARTLSTHGPETLKQEAILRAPWHAPIPQLLSQTPVEKITGYPLYDRDILSPEDLTNAGNATIIGDAAHPMSPFKGQGANRALIDALMLANDIYIGCRPGSNWRNIGIRKSVLEKFEKEMIAGSAQKVRDSREAGKLLHSPAVLNGRETPRERRIKDVD